jgi:hypothetical protein
MPSPPHRITQALASTPCHLLLGDRPRRVDVVEENNRKFPHVLQVGHLAFSSSGQLMLLYLMWYQILH